MVTVGVGGFVGAVEEDPTVLGHMAAELMVELEYMLQLSRLLIEKLI